MPINDDLTITYNIPIEIKKRITRELLVDFKNKIDEIFSVNEERTYYGFYLYMESTSGWYDSFEYVCEKHNADFLMDCRKSLEWYDGDLFDSEFGDMMIEFGIIQEGNPEDYNFDD